MKIIKFLLKVILLLLLVVAIYLLYIYIKGVPTYEYKPTPDIENLKVTADSSRIARGEKIAGLLCIECHRDFKTGNLTGHIMTDLPKEFGTIATLNITQDKEYGIGNWTDGELYYFLRTSVRKDGHYNPIMGGFNLMADEDIYSIIAWLRSDYKPLAPSKDEYPPNEFNLLVKFLCNTVFKPKELPKSKIDLPDTTDLVKFGKYLADGLCGCYTCHSADFKTMDTNIPENSKGFYGGGNPLLNYDGVVVPSANLTMDKSTGIGEWTLQEFTDAVKSNRKRGGGSLHYPMVPHTTLTDYEVMAIWEYLKTVSVISNKVNRFVEN